MTASFLVARSRLTVDEALGMLVSADRLSGALDTGFVDPLSRFDGLLQEIQWNQGAFDASLGTNNAWDDSFGWFRSPLKTSGGTPKAPWTVISELAALYDADPSAFLTTHIGASRAAHCLQDIVCESQDTTPGVVRAATYGGVFVTSDAGVMFDADESEIVWSGPTTGYVTTDAASTTVCSVASVTASFVEGRKLFFGPEELTRAPNILFMDSDGGKLRVNAGYVTIDITGGTAPAPSPKISVGSVLQGATSGAQGTVVGYTDTQNGTITLALWNETNFADGETVNETNGGSDWSATYSAGTQSVTHGDIDHYRDGDRVLLVQDAITGRKGCLTATIDSVDAANDRFTTTLDFDDRYAEATTVQNTFYGSWGTVQNTSVVGTTVTNSDALPSAARKNQIVTCWGLSGTADRGISGIKASLDAMPEGCRVIRTVDGPSIPDYTGGKARYGDGTSWGEGVLFDKHVEYILPAIENTISDLYDAGAVIDCLMLDWEAAAHPGFFWLDGTVVRIQYDAAMSATGMIGFDIATDGYTADNGDVSPDVGSPEAITPAKLRAWAMMSAQHEAMVSYINQIADVVHTYYPNCQVSNFRVGPRLPWRSHLDGRHSAFSFFTAGGKFNSEGQAPMRVYIPAEGDGAIQNPDTLEWYLPAGADGSDADKRWLQMEAMCNRTQEMVLAKARGVAMWFYEKQDPQNAWLQNNALYEDAVLLCLTAQTQQVVGYLNLGQSGTGDDPFQAALVEFNELVPYQVRVPTVLDPPRAGTLYGSAFVRNACSAGGYVFYYVVPKPGATVSISEVGDDVVVAVTSPYSDTWTIPNAEIITATSPSGSGTWIKHTPPAVEVDVPTLTVTVTLPTPDATMSIDVDVPTLDVNVSLPAPAVTTSLDVDVPTLTVGVTFPAPDVGVVIDVDVPTLTVTVSVLAPTVERETVADVPVCTIAVAMPGVDVEVDADTGVVSIYAPRRDTSPHERFSGTAELDARKVGDEGY